MLKLYQKTGHGQFITLSGLGLILSLLEQASDQIGIDPNLMVVRISDGRSGVKVDVNFPTPHTYLFNSLCIKQDKLLFRIGSNFGPPVESLSLANPQIVDEIVAAIRKRAAKHRRTRLALRKI